MVLARELSRFKEVSANSLKTPSQTRLHFRVVSKICFKVGLSKLLSVISAAEGNSAVKSISLWRAWETINFSI